MFARRQTGNISNDFYFIAGFGECDRPGNGVAGGWMQDRNRFRRFLRAGQANTEKEC